MSNDLLRYVDHLRGCASYTNGACSCGLENVMRNLNTDHLTTPAAPSPGEPPKSLLRDPVRVNASARPAETPPVIVTHDGVPCADQAAALEEFKERCRTSDESWRCTRQPWPCRYPNARQCAHDTMLGDDCPRACECECHDRPAALRTSVEERNAAEPPKCTWKYDADGYWQTSCGDQFCFTEGGPTENRVRFCHYCGKEVFESVYANGSGEGESE